ncbi:MAG: hypothetical protein P8107_14120, partial [Spirochaetia bacterium]
YMVGFGSVKNKDAAKEPEGVLYGAPQVSGASLIDAGFPDEYTKEFTVAADQIVYLGDYTWETEFEFSGPGLLIKRSFSNNSAVYSAMLEKYPDIPATMQIVSLGEKTDGSQVPKIQIVP